jgi:hypothetical protein
LPIADRAAFEANAFPDYADVATVNLLSSVLKANEILNTLADDFKVYNSGNMRGLMEGSGDFDPAEMISMGDMEDVGMGGIMQDQIRRQ